MNQNNKFLQTDFFDKIKRNNSPFSPNFIQKRYSCEIRGNKTMEMQELKMQMSTFLQQKQSQDSLNVTGRKSLQIIDDKNHQKNSQFLKRNYTQCFKRHQSKISNLSARKKANPEEDLLDTRRKSFIIKEIKPQIKQKLKQQGQIVVPNIGKTYGSYYQIVAVQKKFHNSRYFQNDSIPLFTSRKDYELNNESGIHNPSSKLKRKQSNYGMFEGDYIQPWEIQNNQHNFVHYPNNLSSRLPKPNKL